MIDSYCSIGFSDAASWPRLLGDIGGTNARFAWQERANDPLKRVIVLPCADFPSLHDAVFAYLQQTDVKPPPWAAFGIANPVVGDQVRMTNHHWSFSIEDTRKQLGFQRLLVLNDFTALALSLPVLPDSSKVLLGGSSQSQPGALALIGPGTGLGVSGLVPLAGGNWAPIIGEGGHVSLSASNAEEFSVISDLQKHYPHVSAERVLSGQGLVNLYGALMRVRGLKVLIPNSAAEVLQRAESGDDAVARDTLELFFGWLGSVAGDLALTLGARGGVFVGGGIVPRVKKHLLQSSFRTRFEAKGRFQEYLHSIPTWLIDAPISPALFGALAALDQLKYESAGSSPCKASS